MPLNPPPVYPLPISLHTAVLMTLTEHWVLAQEPGGPISLVWVPEPNSNCWDFEKQKEKTAIRKFIALIPNRAPEPSRWRPVCTVYTC